MNTNKDPESKEKPTAPTEFADDSVLKAGETIEINQTVSVSELISRKDNQASTLNPSDKNTEGELSGQTFAGKYTILNQIGRGGMSVVYKARHTVLDKAVAIKVLHLDRSKDALSLRRFKQEAQAASVLNHPNIVAVHDFGESENGTPFLVMDYVEGKTLSEIVKSEGPLGLERFLQIMQQVTEGLTVAHQNNVVHRDLKPSNVMIAEVNGKEQAKLLDFGIAKLLSPDNENVQGLTQTGEIFGSPLYMSPEQCTGAIVDFRSDIYSFGCVMYECLSGKVPLSGDSVFETIHKHINEEPPPLVAPQLSNDFRGKLETILLRCLAKSPGDRYQSVAELQTELKTLSLTSKPGLLGVIGGAWEHAAAKRRASKKSRLPLMVITLLTVSIFSTISVATLWGAQQRLNNEVNRLNHSRLILSEVALTQSAFLKFYDAIRSYLMTTMFNSSAPTNYTIKHRLLDSATNAEKALHRIEVMMEQDQGSLKKYRIEWHTKLQYMPSTAKQMLGFADGNNADDKDFRAKARSLYTQGAEAFRALQAMTDEAQSVEKEELGYVTETQEWVGILSYVCILLNATVVVALIVYFAKGSPQRLRKLAERASQLSRKSPGGGQGNKQDELADLDSVLHELASALSEAEEREKALLRKLNEQQEKEIR